jgi:hypothetical protein
MRDRVCFQLQCAWLCVVVLLPSSACGALEVGIEPPVAPADLEASTPEQGAIPLPTPFPSPTPVMQMPDTAITSFAATPDGALWYAFDDFDHGGGAPPDSPYHGLYRSQDRRLSRFEVPGTIRVLAVAPDGSLYIGAGLGVMRYVDGALQTLIDVTYGEGAFTRAFVPYDITFTQDGDVWVGGVYSLARFDGNTWTQYDVNVRRLLVAPDGSLWGQGWDGVAGSDCCFAHVKGDAWTTYTHTAALPVSQELLGDIIGLKN